MLTIYTYAGCDRCRAATRWLRSQGLAFVERAIRETPPSPGELREMLVAQGGNLRRLFNTAGRDYRDLQLGSRLADLNEAEAVSLLAGNGNLVKRPFLIGAGVALVGFDEPRWREALRLP